MTASKILRGKLIAAKWHKACTMISTVYTDDRIQDIQMNNSQVSSDMRYNYILYEIQMGCQYITDVGLREAE